VFEAPQYEAPLPPRFDRPTPPPQPPVTHEPAPHEPIPREPIPHDPIAHEPVSDNPFLRHPIQPISLYQPTPPIQDPNDPTVQYLPPINHAPWGGGQHSLLSIDGEPTLRPGDSSEDVRRLQEILNKLTYGPLEEDGRFGPKTEDAVKRFQKDNDLVEDGVVGENTWEALRARLTDLEEGRDTKPQPRRPVPISPEEQKVRLENLRTINQMLKELEAEMGEEQKEEFKREKQRKIALLLEKAQRDMQDLEDILEDNQPSRERPTNGNGWQENILATHIGTTAQGLNQRAAYGAWTDKDKFVALPSKGMRGKWVEIVLPDGTTARAPVGDIGPWNNSDPYWDTGERPRAETDIGEEKDDYGREYKNEAGIDISDNLWKQMGMGRRGSVRLKWRMIDPPDDGLVHIRTKDGEEITHENEDWAW
jgi:hypothetical protein